MANSDVVSAQRERLSCEAVHRYIFDNVYNEPVSEYRVNILPRLIKNTSASGAINILQKSILLPTSDAAYYVWMISATDFLIGLKLATNTWVDTATITNEYNTLLHMYGVNGRMFHKGKVYLRYNNNRSIIYIAAEKSMVKKCINVTDLNRCYLTIYYDSDIANPVNVTSLYIANSKEMSKYQTTIDKAYSSVEDACQLTVFKNGIEITDIDNTPTIEIGDDIDLIVDKNILFAFDVDLVKDSENPTFYSELDKAYKQLLHIPKALNPDNKVITHTTCDFYVRKWGTSNPEGLYLHRTAQTRSITQVTHNDMAIQLFVLDAYRDYLKTQAISIHCVVRIHDKDNHLVRDANFIDLLYRDRKSVV